MFDVNQKCHHLLCLLLLVVFDKVLFSQMISTIHVHTHSEHNFATYHIGSLNGIGFCAIGVQLQALCFNLIRVTSGSVLVNELPT